MKEAENKQKLVVATNMQCCDNATCKTLSPKVNSLADKGFIRIFSEASLVYRTKHVLDEKKLPMISSP